LVQSYGEPCRSTSEVDYSACGGRDRSPRKGFGASAAIELADEHNGEGIGPEESGAGAKQGKATAKCDGRKDRQTGSAFKQVCRERGEGHGRVKQQAEEKNGHRLQCEGNRSEKQRHGDMCGEREQRASCDDREGDSCCA